MTVTSSSVLPYQPDRELTIFLAVGDGKSRKVIEAILQQLSHHVILSTDSGETMLERCLKEEPDMAIVGQSLADLDTFELVNRMSNETQIPVIAIIRGADLDRAKRLMTDDMMGILVEPVTHKTLRPAIYLARRRHQQMISLEDRASNLENQLQALPTDQRDDENE
ncbi:ANTAR domain-containing response regulator [Rubripirellula reticaptiva]|uniref:ANTAR domain-containing response regulator n=1 Tax=Rubripirellula reticaptiva TaxID=2528013 RepID=UPI001648A5EC|nr:response regulator [Rubripirellula reticaptiva]